jgi:hypothetical protein
MRNPFKKVYCVDCIHCSFSEKSVSPSDGLDIIKRRLEMARCEKFIWIYPAKTSTISPRLDEKAQTYYTLCKSAKKHRYCFYFKKKLIESNSEK